MKDTWGISYSNSMFVGLVAQSDEGEVTVMAVRSWLALTLYRRDVIVMATVC